ncbi:GAF domain-containing protein [Filimonas effusa]|uniref:PAS domain S-box protein n=1 Tax=Filimonas effusa TaxID=2508721 RepID=A0A4V1MAL1_9BACT|nr:GAF domain-containing protein [Filimonas effusa]RXK86256.1 PAS domain S-box protein [Filimonas effusa]
MKTNDDQWLETVKQFLQLNTEADRELQNIVNLAAEIAETPVALLTLLDEDKQWFKAKRGVAMDSTPRQISFCTHAIEAEGMMIVPDTMQDERFVLNPLVTGEHQIRFYAGAPLTTLNGYKVGTLCILDQKPRELTEKQQMMLELLSQQAINKLELLLTIKHLNQTLAEAEYQKKQLQEKSIRLRAFFEGFNSCYLLIDRENRLLDFNHAAAALFKQLQREDLWVGRPLENFIDANLLPAVQKGVAEALAGQSSKNEAVGYYENEAIWWEMHFSPAKDHDGKIIGVSFNSIDISANKKQQQAILIQNSSLRQIAYIQSHEFRKPVASILGLMHLIKDSNYEEAAFYLPYMEEAVNELDEKIKISVDYTATIPLEAIKS